MAGRECRPPKNSTSDVLGATAQLIVAVVGVRAAYIEVAFMGRRDWRPAMTGVG
jgi:hypothetical protein